MSPLDRIAQLTSQLADARDQAARDSATIARLASDKAKLRGCLSSLLLRIDSMRLRSDWLPGENLQRLAESIASGKIALAQTEGVTA